MLGRARQAAFLNPLLRNPRLTRSYYPFTCDPSAASVRYAWHFSRSRPVLCRSFNTTRTPTAKLRDAINKARHDHPVMFPTLLIASFASVCYLALLSYDEYTREEPEIGAFPPAVERHLRSAIWHTEIRPEPGIAVDCFMRALEQAEREGMDPFSPEFTGIHIRLAAALEKFGRAKGAIEILSRLVESMIERIEDIDRGRVSPRKPQTTNSNAIIATGADDVSEPKPPPEAHFIERGRLLKQVIECKVKISQLYESDYVQDNGSAKRSIDEAVKSLVEAMHDPTGLQFDENRAGISADEAAAMLSQAGGSNITNGNYGTALEIFKLALIAVRKSTEGKPSCREAFTLSNMHNAVSMMLNSPNAVIDGKPATEASIKQARQIAGGWAQQSLQCAQAVDPAVQDQFCAMAVISSWSGMASMLMELGDLKGARGMWEQVIQNSASQPALKQLVPTAHAALNEIKDRETG